MIEHATPTYIRTYGLFRKPDTAAPHPNASNSTSRHPHWITKPTALFVTSRTQPNTSYEANGSDSQTALRILRLAANHCPICYPSFLPYVSFVSFTKCIRRLLFHSPILFPLRRCLDLLFRRRFYFCSCMPRSLCIPALPRFHLFDLPTFPDCRIGAH